jgi:hypothetical protein
MKVDPHVTLGPAGGMVDTPAKTPPGYAQRLRNCFFRVGSWAWRATAQKLHAVPYAYALAGAFAFKSTGPGDPTWTLMAMTGGTDAVAAHFVRLVGNSLVLVPYQGTFGPGSGLSNAWRRPELAFTTDAVAYSCRRERKGGDLYRVTTSAVTNATIVAPLAPTVVDSAGSGVLPGGDYPVAYRYRTVDGMYSPWSPVVVATISPSKKRNWTITNSTHPLVVARELGVGFPDGDVGNVYVAAEVPDNTTTTVEEEVLPAAYDIARRRRGTTLGPPANPEDVAMWDGRLWAVSNDPSPLVWPCAIDSGGAVFTLYEPNEALAPTTGDQRAVAFVVLDDGRGVLMTDAAGYVVEPSADSYIIRQMELSTGAVSASAVAAGAGIVAWFDGRRIMASRGGAAEIVSRGWAEKRLAKIPEAYADRVSAEYVPDDGGAFLFCIPSTPTSTAPDLVIGWRPSGERPEWFTADYLGGGKAPSAITRSSAPTPGGYTLGVFQNEAPRIHRLDAVRYRDEGPENVRVEIETAYVELPEKYGAVRLASIHIGVRRRADHPLPGVAATISATVQVVVNDGAETTAPVTLTLSAGQYLHGRLPNHTPAARVHALISFNHPDALEVFDVWGEAVYFKRDEART